MVIALDFDGTIRRLPFPFNLIMKYTSPTDILERAKLNILKRIIFYFIIFYCPTTLDGKFIAKFQNEDVVIISGRRERTEEMSSILRKYLHIKKVYFRKNCAIHEKDWKLMICRKEKVDLFYEDRKYVVSFLRKNGINVVEVRT